MKTQNPLIGRASQKFSNSIFSTWKGINVVRSKPLEVSNPQSPAQTTQRNKFAGIVSLARQALNTVKLGLKSLAVQKSEYNAFISENIEYQLTDGTGITPGTLSFQVFAKGTLSQVSNLIPTETGLNLVTTWSNANRPFSTPLDKVCICAIFQNSTTNALDVFREISRETLASAETDTSAIPQIAGYNISYVYIFPYNNINVGDSFGENIV